MTKHIEKTHCELETVDLSLSDAREQPEAAAIGERTLAAYWTRQATQRAVTFGSVAATCETVDLDEKDDLDDEVAELLSAADEDVLEDCEPDCARIVRQARQDLEAVRYSDDLERTRRRATELRETLEAWGLAVE